MSIAGIGSGAFKAVTGATAEAAPATGATQASSASVEAGSGGGLMLSPRSQFLSNLRHLMQTEPAQAQQLVSGLAARMRERASEQSGPSGARWNALATRLQSAADSGNLASLFDGPAGATASSPGAAAYAAMAITRSS